MKKQAMSLVVVILVSAVSMAGLIEVGSGDNFANVYIEWSDGYIANFKVSFETESVTGLDLITTIDTVLGDNFVIDFNWGTFVDGFTYTDPDNNIHSNVGFGGGDNWWHYWIMDAGESSWISPQDFGAGGRQVSNGDSDGWIYGRGGAPVPEPMTLALFAMGSVMLARRRNV